MDLRVAIVGASLGGLSAANVLQQLGVEVSVFELFPHGFHTRGGALGSVDIDLLQKIRGDVDGKLRRPISSHGHFYGDLWQYLFEALPDHVVRFGVDVTEIVEPESDEPQLLIDGTLRKFDLIIGADGGRSMVRPYVTDQQASYAGYTVWRGLVLAEGIEGPPSGEATIWGISYQTLGFPCVGPEGTLWNCGIYMAMPISEVEKPSRNRQVKAGLKTVPTWFVPFVRHCFGDANAKFWDECSKKGKVSPHPVWEFAADVVVRNRIALLGDAAHMASPRTGAGALNAMMDAVELGEALRMSRSLEASLVKYNENVVQRGKQLYRRSRQAASYFAPPGIEVVPPSALLPGGRPGKFRAPA